MERALQWAGYEVEHVWGEDAHNHNHGAAIFPQAMRWLWKDYPQPVATHPDRSSSRAREMLVDGAGWELIGDGYQWAEGLAVTSDGTLYFSDVPASKIYRVLPAGKPEVFAEDSGQANGLALGPDGRLYGASSGAKKILAWDLQTRASEVVAEGFASNDLVVLHDGSIYVTDPEGKRIWHIDPAKRESKPVDTFDGCNGITVSPDQTLLYVAHFPGRFIFSYQIDDGWRSELQTTLLSPALAARGNRKPCGRNVYQRRRVAAERYRERYPDLRSGRPRQPDRTQARPGPPGLLCATARKYAVCRHGRRGLETNGQTVGRPGIRATCLAAQTGTVTNNNSPATVGQNKRIAVPAFAGITVCTTTKRRNGASLVPAYVPSRLRTPPECGQ